MKAAPSGALVTRLTGAMLRAGKPDDALKTLGEWVKKNPDDIVALEQMGEINIALNKLDDATVVEIAKRAEDLAGVARTLSRAGALERAEMIADLAVERGGGRRAHQVRGDIVKARGDKQRAILEYERALAEGNPAEGATSLNDVVDASSQRPSRSAHRWLADFCDRSMTSH